MPYCPGCRGEFQDWVQICPDCQVNLVSELAPVPQNKQKTYSPLDKKKINEPILPVASAPDELIASMWQGILKDNGINCLLGTGSSVLTSQGQKFGVPVTIFTLASEVKRAREILDFSLEE